MINPKIIKLIYIDALTSVPGGKIFVDLNQITENFLALKEIAPDNLSFIFPVKSFPKEPFLTHISSAVAGYEFSNENEFNLIKDSITNTSILLASNLYGQHNFLSKFKDQITYDLSYFDQITEAQYFNKMSLRLSPPQSMPQGEKTRFGFIESELEELSAIEVLSNKVCSLHFHIGFEKTTLLDFIRCIDYSLSIKNKYFPSITSINIGGGINTLSEADLTALFEYISKLPLQFTMEAGRYFTENACYAVGKVLACRTRNNQHEVLLNLSRECHLKWSWPKSFNILNTSLAKEKRTLSGELKIYGNTAFEGDLILTAQLKQAISVAPGDHIIFNRISGYSVAWNHSFNGLPPAKIIFL